MNQSENLSLSNQLAELKSLALFSLNQKEFLTLEEAASFLGCSKSAIQKACSKKVIPYYQPFAKSLFKRTELIDWVEAHKIESMEEIKEKAKDYLKKAI